MRPNPVPGPRRLRDYVITYRAAFSALPSVCPIAHKCTRSVSTGFRWKSLYSRVWWILTGSGGSYRNLRKMRVNVGFGRRQVFGSIATFNGANSRGPCRHSGAAWYISYGEPLLECTKGRMIDPTAHGQASTLARCGCAPGPSRPPRPRRCARATMPLGLSAPLFRNRFAFSIHVSETWCLLVYISKRTAGPLIIRSHRLIIARAFQVFLQEKSCVSGDMVPRR
jgi:hypothetical protein